MFLSVFLSDVDSSWLPQTYVLLSCEATTPPITYDSLAFCDQGVKLAERLEGLTAASRESLDKEEGLKKTIEELVAAEVDVRLRPAICLYSNHFASMWLQSCGHLLSVSVVSRKLTQLKLPFSTRVTSVINAWLFSLSALADSCSKARESTALAEISR